MSRSMALIKFLDSGNIYMGLYSGTTDIMYPLFAESKECWSDAYGGYAVIDHISSICEAFQEPIYSPSDISNIEIYSDYGGGFFWEGKGVESCRLILPEYRFPFGNTYPDPWTGDTSDMIEVCDGAPEWAEEFMNKIFNRED